MTPVDTVAADRAELDERTAAAGVHCTRIVHHTDKAIVAFATRDGLPVVAKLLTTAEPYWIARRDHELQIYHRFTSSPPPVRAPRLIWHDDRLTILSHLPGKRLDDHRHLTTDPPPDHIDRLLATIERVRHWQPEPELPILIDYPARVAAEHDAELLDRDDRTLLERLLADTGGELAPAHGDPLPANLLLDADTWTLVDWEHAGRYLPGYDLAVLYTSAAHASPILAQAIIDRVNAAGASAVFAVNALLLSCREIRMHRSLPYGPVRTDRLAALAVHHERVRALLRHAV